MKPMLAVPSTGASNRHAIRLEALASTHQWIVDEKLDGIRCMFVADGPSGNRLINRTGTDITERFPEVARARIPRVTLDGEIVADDGSFLTVASRDKQTGDFARAARAYPCHLVAFDLIRSGGESLERIPFKTRRFFLTKVIGKRRRRVRVVRWSEDMLAFAQQIRSEGGEGVIAKHRDSLYLPGKRSEHWIKFKNTRSLTAVVTGYTRGKGSRELGALKLALVNGEKIVAIGHVGTGFTERQADEFKIRLDAGQPFMAEIEALNRTPSGELRFPVFKGERTDLTLLDAAFEQLETLPTY